MYVPTYAEQNLTNILLPFFELNQVRGVTYFMFKLKTATMHGGRTVHTLFIKSRRHVINNDSLLFKLKTSTLIHFLLLSPSALHFAFRLKK